MKIRAKINILPNLQLEINFDGSYISNSGGVNLQLRTGQPSSSAQVV